VLVLRTGVVFMGALSKPCLHGSPTRWRATCASWRGVFHWRTGSAQSLLRLSERRDLRPSEGRLLCVRVSHTFPAPIQVFLAIPNHVSKPVCIAPWTLAHSLARRLEPSRLGCKAKCSCRRARKSPEASGARGGLLSGLVLIQLTAQMDDRGICGKGSAEKLPGPARFEATLDAENRCV